MTIEISGGSSVFPMPNPHPAGVQKAGGHGAERPQAAGAQPASRAEVAEAVRQANEFIKPVSDSIEFSLDQDSGKLVVKMVDLETRQVIRQFPSEEMLALARAMDKLQGLLVEQKA